MIQPSLGSCIVMGLDHKIRHGDTALSIDIRHKHLSEIHVTQHVPVYILFFASLPTITFYMGGGGVPMPHVN